MKVLLLANNITWTSELKKKVENVKKFFAPLGSFEFTIEQTNYKDFPLSEYGDSYGGVFKSVDETWFDDNISIPSRNRGFDIVCLLLPKDQWTPFRVQGYGSPNDCGIEEVVLLANKTGKYSFNGVKYSGDQFTHILQHEILHRLYSQNKLTDNTHKFYLEKTPEKCLEELKPRPTPNLAIIVRQPSTKQTMGDLVALKDGATFSCKTLERDSTVRIPAGSYECEWTYSPRFKRYLYLIKVPNNEGIRFHPGNYFTDSEGCILLGKSFSDLNKDGELDLIGSKETTTAFEKFFGGLRFQLLVF